MKTLHTPAPWNIAGLSLKDHEAFIIESESQTICWTSKILGKDNEFVSAEDQANALLIAAAPELLEALVSLLPIVDQHVSIEALTKPEQLAVEAARHAIAKAKGERIK